MMEKNKVVRGILLALCWLVIFFLLFGCRSVKKTTETNTKVAEKIEAEVEIDQKIDHRVVKFEDTLLRETFVIETFDTIGRVTERRTLNREVDTSKSETQDTKTENKENRDFKKSLDTEKIEKLRVTKKPGITAWALRLLLIVGIVVITFNVVRKGRLF